MKQTLTLRQKLLVIIIGISTIIFSLAIGYISINAKKAAMGDAIAVTNAIAEKYASEIKAMLEKDLVAMQTLSNSVLAYKFMPEKQWKEIFAKMYYEIIMKNPQFLAIWDSWELIHIDPKHTNPYGRYVAEFWREGQQIKSNFSLKSMTGDSPEYARIKQKAIDCIENPYFYSYTGKDHDQVLMTSLISPILENGKYIGVVGIDISLERYHPIISQIKPFNNSYAFLVSNDLQYTAHPIIEKHGQNLLEDYEVILDRYGATQKIINGEVTSFIAHDTNGIKSYFQFTPIYIEKTGTPWSLAIIVPQSTILEKANRNFLISIIAGLLGLIVLTLVIFFASQYIIQPLLTITSTIKRMALGNISEDMKLSISTNDEIGEMAAALNTTIDGLSQKVTFASNIGKDHLDHDFHALSKEDVLGAALLDMRQSIKNSRNEEEKRMAEDSRRRWANEGIAKFGEILRQNNDDLYNLSKSIIKELVEMLEANQSGLFLFNDDDPDEPHFELAATYAYSRFKHKQKRILLGEGLIGACAQEKKTIFLTEIPEGYIEITSGLGNSNPNALLIVPLNMEGNILGVIEIASFRVFNDYQIEFVERIAQTIASTLTAVKINIKTAALLAKTQQQAEEMQAQEEEMRQNMEELQATQEESFRKSTEMQGFIDALNNSSFVIEYDALGYITSINNAYLELLGLTRDEVVGTHHSDKLDLDPEKRMEYEKMWNDLMNGIPCKLMNRFIVNEKSFVFQETYTPLKDEQGVVYKILKISNNVTNLVTKK